MTTSFTRLCGFEIKRLSALATTALAWLGSGVATRLRGFVATRATMLLGECGLTYFFCKHVSSIHLFYFAQVNPLKFFSLTDVRKRNVR